MITLADEKKHTFLTKKKQKNKKNKKNLWKSLPHIFNFNQSKNLRSIAQSIWINGLNGQTSLTSWTEQNTYHNQSSWFDYFN